ncbi:hypothetical protein ACUOFC_69235, partial [Escherichia sp. TWPC-MK]
GINALTINYDFSGSHTLRSDYGSQETDTSYLNLRNGLNIGPWRLRNYSIQTRAANLRTVENIARRP